VPIPPELEGASLAPIIRGDRPRVRDWLFAAYRDRQRMVRSARSPTPRGYKAGTARPADGAAKCGGQLIGYNASKPGRVPIATVVMDVWMISEGTYP
jgi:hypothetical protein